MEAYLQTSEGVGAADLEVQFPDPPDGSLIIPICWEDVVKAYFALTDVVGRGDYQMWIRVYPGKPQLEVASE